MIGAGYGLYLRSGGRGSAGGGETQGAVERGTGSVSASFAGRKEERDRERSSEKGKPLCVGFSVSLRNAVAFSTANIYPGPLHVVEASYP